MSRVECYRVHLRADVYDEVVSDEANALIRDPKLKVAAGRLLGWLQAAQAGQALPGSEPFAPPADGITLRYRCDGAALVMFDYMDEADLVLVLAFAAAATALPTVEVCREAARRRQNWRTKP